MGCVQLFYQGWLFSPYSAHSFCNRHASECHVIPTINNGKEWHCWEGRQLALKRPVLQVTVVIFSWSNVCLGSVCFYLKGRVCADDGAAVAAGARTCAACRIVHVWVDNSCLGHHHTGTTLCSSKLTPFISTTIVSYWKRKFYCFLYHLYNNEPICNQYVTWKRGCIGGLIILII